MRANRLVLLVAASAAAILGAPAPGRAMIVYDPANTAQSALAAARLLQSLSNQAQQLANEARSLSASPLSQAGSIGQSLSSLDQVSRSVTGLATTAAQLQTQFSQLFPASSSNASGADLIAQSLTRLQAARDTAQDLANLSAELTGRGAAQQGRVQASLLASQGASGETSAIQSSTQLMGVLSEQLAGLQSIMASEARLAAEQAAAQSADRQAALQARALLWSHATTPPGAPAFTPFSHAGP
jgi:P-type conjugative transfer protein TrbJ